MSLPPPLVQAGNLIEERLGLAASTLFPADFEALMDQLAAGDVASYVSGLRASSVDSPQWQRLISALTIGETYFLRGQPHFDLLRQRILPELMRKRRQEGRWEMTVWSVGCATGEEPYSIATILHEMIPDLPAWKVRIFGTDINGTTLEKAHKGVYRQWSFRHTDPAFVKRYFTPTKNGMFLKPFIHDMVSFRLGNLLDGPPMPQADIIFCRNVLLYFSSHLTEQAENVLFDTLAPGGWLLLGPSEAVHTRRDRWITHIFPGAVMYQRPPESVKLAEGGAVAYNRPDPQSLEKTPPNETVAEPATYQDAVDAMQSDQLGVAEVLLAELLARHPHHARAHTLLACLFANRQAVPEAHAHLDAALHADPMLADAHYIKGVLLLEGKENAEARKALQAALYCQRDHPLANLLLGSLYAQDGDLSRARRSWLNARETAASLPADAPVSDLNDMKAGYFAALVEQQLVGLE